MGKVRTPSARWRWLVAGITILFVACNSEPGPSGLDAKLPLWRTSTAEPYPYTTPIPPLEPTAIDGTYTRSISRAVAGGGVLCKRCAPYRIEMGETTLVFEEGRYLLHHVAPGQPDSSQFTARGHFVIDGAQITLFNDANCSRERGVYEWSLSQGQLRLTAIDDPCPFSRLRERFLEASTWLLAEEPYAFHTPVPPLEVTSLDGVYTRTLDGTTPKCGRCAPESTRRAGHLAPYRAETGETTLTFDRGRFRVTESAADAPAADQFTTRGHYLVDGARVTLYNDPVCPDTRGIYRWEVTTGSLRLEAIEDVCPHSQLRMRFLEASRWELTERASRL